MSLLLDKISVNTTVITRLTLRRRDEEVDPAVLGRVDGHSSGSVRSTLPLVQLASDSLRKLYKLAFGFRVFKLLLSNDGGMIR